MMLLAYFIGVRRPEMDTLLRHLLAIRGADRQSKQWVETMLVDYAV
jgi:hypothetical protein